MGDGSGSIDCAYPIDREGAVARPPPDRVDLDGVRVGQKELLVAGTSASREILAGTAAETAERTRQLADEAGDRAREVAGQAGEVARDVAGQAVDGAMDRGQGAAGEARALSAFDPDDAGAVRADDIPRWRTRGSDVRYDNPWITVTHREVTAPTGVDGIYGVVHFKSRARSAWCRSTRSSAPGSSASGATRSTRGAGRSPRAARPRARRRWTRRGRELVEECGLVATSWTRLLEIHTSNSVTDELGEVWLSRAAWTASSVRPTTPSCSRCAA